MYRILGSDGIYNKGKKCDLMEFENPLNQRQELLFLCYCNLNEPRANCQFVNYNNSTFNSSVTNQVRSAYFNANIATDLRLVNNQIKYTIKYYNSTTPNVSNQYDVIYDDNGIMDISNKSYVVQFKNIDDDKDNKCLLYYNNYENIPAFNNTWNPLVGNKRECCHRFTTDSLKVQHYVCVVGNLCTAWNKLLIKKTKI